VSDLEHHAERLVDQRPDVVHDRLLELAERLRDEAPPIEPGTQAATLLGVTGPLGIEIADRGPERIEVRTTNGRIRGEGSATLTPTEDGRTTLAMNVAIKPQGFAANLMLGVALRTIPGVERDIVDGLERGLDDLATELAKPEPEWDAASWRPVGIPTRD
jgi:hypothetical protein